MKYYEVTFTIKPATDDARDIVAALAGEAAFETFEETTDGLKGYVQQQLFDDTLLRQTLDACPLPDLSVSYTVSEAEDRDWNEQWEQEGFEPILVEGGGLMVEGGRSMVEGGRWMVDGEMRPSILIHDGRHLANLERLDHLERLEIEIDTHLAFGTGTHETTRLMCAALLDLFSTHHSPSTIHPSPSTIPHPPRVLDCGTGTGILAITALKLGAGEAVGYDIDEWSADNARHNAVINRVDDRFTSLLGDATILNKVEGVFDIVTANINRNILLADMPAFVAKMAPQATLLLSGFYTDDIPLLVAKAEELGLQLVAQREDNTWACLQFTHLSPLTSHHSLLTTHHSLPTTHHSLLTTHHSPLTTHPE